MGETACDALSCTGAGINLGIKRILPDPQIVPKALCLLALLTLEGWQSGRMRRS